MFFPNCHRIVQSVMADHTEQARRYAMARKIGKSRVDGSSLRRRHLFPRDILYT